MQKQDDDYDSDNWDDEIKERNDKRQRIGQIQSSLAALVAVATRKDDKDSNKLSSSNSTSTRSKKYRSRQNDGIGCMKVKDQNGNMVKMSVLSSPWYTSYIECPLLDDPAFLRLFRRRFRVSYSAFRELDRLVSLKENEVYFAKWSGQHAKTPISVLVLGSLRYLGRGWTFDDLYESTAIHEEVHRQFFHCFIDFASKVLFAHYVSIPTTSDEARSAEYESAGMAGCIGSMDATHILCEKIPYDLAHEHKGFKMSSTARTYNLVVNNRRRILSTTSGHPARWNDKTLVKYDKIACSLYNGTSEALDNHQFVLYEQSHNGEVKEQRYRGAWLLVDNGYLPWSCTIPPIKTTDSVAELRFSQWVESLRKDVECTFGIMKGRFRILKAGIRLHGTEACNKVWHTCCALHNMMLQMDGLDSNDEWLTDLGNFTEEDIEQAVPFAMQRLYNPLSMQAYDSSGMGVGTDRDDAVDDDEISFVDERPSHVQLATSIDSDGFRKVRCLSMEVFRKQLIQHFHILFTKNKLKWPQRSS